MICCCGDAQRRAAGVEWTTGRGSAGPPPHSFAERATPEAARAGEAASQPHLDREPPPCPAADYIKPPSDNKIIEAAAGTATKTNQAVARVPSCLSFLPCLKLLQEHTKPIMEIDTFKSVNAWSARFFKSMSLTQFEQFLAGHGVPMELFGTKNAKTLAELWKEVTTGACCLETRKPDDSSGARLQRSVRTVVTEVKAKIAGEDKFLLMKDVILPQGVKRTNINQRMARSFKSTEGYDMISQVYRAFKDNLHLDQRSFKAHFDLVSVRKEEETRDSIGYPGMPCIYTLVIAEVRVLHPSTPVLSHIGLPSGAEFQTKRAEPKGTTRRTWMWCSRIVFQRAMKAISLDADKEETKGASKGAASAPMGEDEARTLGEEVKTLAWRGRYANAYRTLQSLETAGRNPYDFVDESIVERVRRITPMYAEALQECGKAETNMSDMGNYLWLEELQSEIVYLFKGKTLSVAFSRYVQNVNVSSLVAAIAENDIIQKNPQDYTLPATAPTKSWKRKNSLSGIPTDLAAECAVSNGDDEYCMKLPTTGGGWNASIRCSVELGRPIPSDSIWHTMTKEPDVPVRSDDVLHISIVDALDEPCNSIFIFMYTMLNTDALGSQPPPVLKGHTRQPWNFTTFKYTPHRDGIRFFIIVDAELHPAVIYILKWLPTVIMKKVLTKIAKTLGEDLEQFARHSVELRERMKISARAPLYESLRQRTIEARGKET